MTRAAANENGVFIVRPFRASSYLGQRYGYFFNILKNRPAEPTFAA